LDCNRGQWCYLQHQDPGRDRRNLLALRGCSCHIPYQPRRYRSRAATVKNLSSVSKSNQVRISDQQIEQFN
jgi:hypothetical protein